MLKPHWVRLGTSTQSGESSGERPGITLSLLPSPLLHFFTRRMKARARVCGERVNGKGREKERACVIARSAHADARVYGYELKMLMRGIYNCFSWHTQHWRLSDDVCVCGQMLVRGRQSWKNKVFFAILLKLTKITENVSLYFTPASLLLR